MPETAVSNDEFTGFWNNVLVAKFERFRNILLDGTEDGKVIMQSNSSTITARDPA